MAEAVTAEVVVVVAADTGTAAEAEAGTEEAAAEARI